MKDKLAKRNKNSKAMLLRKVSRVSFVIAILSIFVSLPIHSHLNTKREELAESYHQLAEQVSEQKETTLFGNLKKQLESIGQYFRK